MSLAEVIAQASKPQPPASSWKWGTVTATAPLRVRLDGDDDALDITPDALAVVGVGDRVWCQLHGATAKKRLIILGKAV